MKGTNFPATGDALNTAQEDGADQQHQRQASDPFWDGEIDVQCIGDGIGLYHISDAEPGNAGK